MYSIQRTQLFRSITSNTSSCCRIAARPKNRHFSITAASRTDGVFRKLTEMRIPTPWIVALRDKQRQEKELGGTTESAGKTPIATESDQADELVPKSMSDSYVSVVLPLGQDKWLSDTYLNSEGNVRCDPTAASKKIAGLLCVGY
jgi:acyl-coenzyme A thioesterase 9